MMNQVDFGPWLHKLLWCEAAQTATDIDIILVWRILTNAPPFMRLYGNDAKLSFKHLAKCVLQLSMPISRQVQKLIHMDDCACLLDNLQFMLVMCITSFIQKPIKLFTVMMFKC